ncbi:peptidylprolyl isomerase [Buchnera aphidicola (Brachycaudus cardui)]|uniref:Chaperone SurA n=1 Tax=Buchnera aphidicola (Brachycaudus cardui) TaxID=557993 RepID=A0A4D6XU33_9GAMM|nr:peptidylprolyl isomerase [Buchnera aphidicola]QCI20293.1 peptidylprolyl isomerase [Buchnera aphidicola (Brachycaudus cardui)]
MKVWICIILYVFSTIFCVASKELEIDNITAIINDQIILKSDINKILSLFEKEDEHFKIPLKINFLKEKVIQKLILENLILQEASNMHIVVTKEQINTMIQKIALKKKISVDQLKNNILFNSHFTYKNYINNIKKLLTIKMIQDYELNKRINISEKEVNFVFKKLIENNKQLKKINLSYILLPFLKENSNFDINNKKKIAESIIIKLKKGYDFEKLYAECKKKNSLFLVKKMFWMNFQDIQNSFSNAFNIIEKGQILGPILGNKGLYIFKVNNINNNQENVITEFYIQHCLIKPSIILTDLESKNNILDIYKNIKKGIYSFDYAVKNFSQDFYSSNKNGDIGWISEESFNSNVNKVLLSLKKNEISKPIKSNFGWHIVKLLDKRQVDKFYHLKRREAYNILFLQKMTLEKRHWIENLKHLSYIKIIGS